MRSLFTVLAFLLLTSTSVSAQSAGDLFQQARVIEQTQGDLLGAIALYERVVDASGDRSLTAEALVRIGQNYERLGRDGALEAYQRVVSDFGDLTEPVGIARERLAVLVIPTATTPDALPNSIAFKVPGRASPWGHLSADGQRLVTIERSNTMADGGALLIMDLVQNSFTTLVPGRPGGFAQSPRFSPDQKQVAYGWWDGEGRAYIKVLDLPTGSIRTVLDLHSHFADLPGVAWTDGPFDPYVLDWTEDGSELLVYNWVDGIGDDWYSNLMMVPVDGSPSRVVARDEAVANWTYGYGCLTGDDRYAVLDYAVRDFPHPFLQRIDLTTGESERWRASDTRPFELVDCRGPSGEVVYQSDQLSNRFLYAEEGSTPASESPTNRLKSVNSDFTVLAGSNRGAIATLDDEMRPFKLLAVELDVDGQIGEVVETLQENGTRTVPGRWSPDGSAFAWVSPRPAVAHVWNARTNGRQSFALDYETIPYAVLWSPDGDDLWLLSREQGDVSVSVLDLSTGTRSADDPIGSIRVYDLGHDGQSLIVQAEHDPLCIERLDLATRATSPLHCASAEDGSRLGARASQDYQHYLTYVVGESPIGAVLGILDAPSGAVRTVFRPQGYTLETRMGWLRLAEPSTITFAEFKDRAGSFDKLFRLDVERGTLSPMWAESLSLMNLNYYQIEARGKMAVIKGRLKTDSWAGRVVRY